MPDLSSESTGEKPFTIFEFEYFARDEDNYKSFQTVRVKALADEYPTSGEGARKAAEKLTACLDGEGMFYPDDADLENCDYSNACEFGGVAPVVTANNPKGIRDLDEVCEALIKGRDERASPKWKFKEVYWEAQDLLDQAESVCEKGEQILPGLEQEGLLEAAKNIKALRKSLSDLSGVVKGMGDVGAAMWQSETQGERNNKPWSAEVAMPDGSRKTVGLNLYGQLFLGGGTLPPGTALPEGLKYLSLDGGTLPAGTALPEGLEWLSLGGGTLPAGAALPEGLERLSLGGGTLPAGTAIPEGCNVWGAGPEGIYGPVRNHFLAPEPASEAAKGGVRV